MPRPRPGRSRWLAAHLVVTLQWIFLLGMIPHRVHGQVVSGDTIPADSVSPIQLLPIEVEILRTSIGRDQAPYSVRFSDARGSRSPLSGGLLASALQGVPGLMLLDRHNLSLGESLAIRGQGSRAQFGTRGVHVSVDGVPATLPDGQTTLDHLFFPAIDRIEVLAGPSSALYGNGAGGTVRFIGRRPSEAPFAAEGTLYAGSHGTRGVHSLSSGTVGSTGYLVGLGTFRTEGFRSDPTETGSYYGGGRRAHLRGSLHRPLGAGQLRVRAGYVSLTSENPGALTREDLADPRRPANPFFVGQETGKDLHQADLSLQWAGSVGHQTAELSVWGLTRAVDNPIPPRIVDLDRKAAGVAAVVSGFVPGPVPGLRWTMGADVGSQVDERSNRQNQEGAPGALTLDQREGVLGTGAFAQIAAPIKGNGLLLGALRYQQTRFEVTDRFLEPLDTDDSGSRAMGAWSPSLALSLPLQENLVPRVSFATFFQTPTTTELVNQATGVGGLNPELEPVTGWSLEGGLRASGTRGAELDVAFFLTRVANELIPFEVESQPGRTFFRNAGSSEYSGLEFSARSPDVHGLLFRGAATFLRARFREFTVGGISRNGNRIPGNPDHLLEGSATWTGRFFGSPFPAFLEARWVHRGTMTVDDENNDRVGTFGLLDLRLGLDEIPVGPSSFGLVAELTNLLDRRHVSAVSINAFGGRFFHPGPGRAFQLGISVTPPSSGRVDRP